MKSKSCKAIKNGLERNYSKYLNELTMKKAEEFRKDLIKRTTTAE